MRLHQIYLEQGQNQQRFDTPLKAMKVKTFHLWLISNIQAELLSRRFSLSKKIAIEVSGGVSSSTTPVPRRRHQHYRVPSSLSSTATTTVDDFLAGEFQVEIKSTLDLNVWIWPQILFVDLLPERDSSRARLPGQTIGKNCQRYPLKPWGIFQCMMKQLISNWISNGEKI